MSTWVQMPLFVKASPGVDVLKPTRDELLQWRTDLLAHSRHTEAELYRLAAEYELRSDERAIYEAVRSVDWLLNG